MKKLFCYFAIVLFLLQSCEFDESPCEAYYNEVARMNLPELSTRDYNSVNTVFYRLGHSHQCAYPMPLSQYDTLMMYGYVTDTLQGGAIYKITDNAVPANNVTFVLLSVGDIANKEHLPDSIVQSIHKKIRGNKGKRIYMKGILLRYYTDVPLEISLVNWGEDSPWFSVPLVLIQSEENIYFEN